MSKNDENCNSRTKSSFNRYERKNSFRRSKAIKRYEILQKELDQMVVNQTIWDYNIDFIHPTICETLYRVLNIVQDGSHNEGSLKLKVDDYSRKYTFGYLYKSVVYGLLEILCYFGELIKNNQNIEENQSRRKRIDHWIEGRITQLKPNGWADFESNCKQYILGIPEMYVGSDFKIGSSCRIQLKKENQKHITKVEII